MRFFNILNSYLVATVVIMCGFTFAQAKVAVKVKLSPAGSFIAKTESVSGFAYKTADGVAAENVVVKANTLDTGISLRDKHLKERLQTNKYPEIKLVKASGKNGSGSAIIEIMGKQQNVSGKYKTDVNKLTAQFKMNLPSLGIEKIKYMGIGVADDVVVEVQLPIKSK